MDNKDREVLLKILRHIHHAVHHCSKYETQEDFEADDMCVEATVFNLMQIGELSKISLSNEAKAAIKNIPWKQIYGLRNRIVHGYDGIDLTIVWTTVKEDLEVLENEIKAALKESRN